MDYDSEARYIEAGDYRYALNIRNTIGYIYKSLVGTKVRGNVTVSFTLPTGENRSIGAYEDKRFQTIIYMIWNSNGNHGIYRYHRLTNGQPTGNGFIEHVTTYDFRWSRNEKITGIDLVDGKLLYWVDRLMPRKINIEKATENKPREYHLIKLSPATTSAQFTLTNPSGTQVFSQTGFTWTSADAYADDLNNNPAVNVYLKAESCGNNYVKITLFELGTYTITFTSGTNEAIAIPQNFYPSITDEVIDAGKYPYLCPLEFTLEKDSSRQTNYLEEIFFQFAAIIRYDDYEESTLSIVSDITMPTCTTGDYNCINIDFTLDRLQVLSSLSIIREIDLYAREGNTGNWTKIKTIQQHEFWDESGVLTSNIHRFYNDGVYPELSSDITTLPYSRIPVVAKAQEFVEDVLAYGNVTENYDLPCFDGGIDVGFVPTPKVRKFSISGIIRIWSDQQFETGGNPNIFTEGRIGMVHWLEDFEDNRDFPVFGGVKLNRVLTTTGSQYNQYLPGYGWPVYISGTDVMSYSRQSIIHGLTTREQGVVDTASAGLKDEAREWYARFGSGTPQGDMISEWQLTGLTAGVYIIRVASHLCSPGDLMGLGFMYDTNRGRAYQRTSTYLKGFAPANNLTTVEEVPEIIVVIEEDGSVEVKTKNNATLYSLPADPNRTDVYIGDFWIEDLTVMAGADFDDPTRRGQSTVDGYLIDAAGSTSPELLKAGLVMERQIVEATQTGLLNQLANNPPVRISKTDHNGFFFFKRLMAYDVPASINYNFTTGTKIRAKTINNKLIKDFGDYYYVGGLRELYDGTMLQRDGIDGLVDVDPLSSASIILANTNSTISTDERVSINGRIVDIATGDGVPNVLVVFERNGRYERTDAEGNFSIVAYGAGDVDNGNRVEDSIHFLIDDHCDITFNNGKNHLTYGVYIDPISSTGFNASNPYAPSLFNNIQVSIVGGDIRYYLKNGGAYRFAAFYVDALNRRCGLFSNDSMDIQLPFITENVQAYFPNLPSQQADGYFQVTFNINNQPPEYAHALYIVRTRNTRYNNYEQFPIQDVKYVAYYDRTDNSIIETTFAGGNANQIWINLDNSFVNYANYFAGSQKGWTFGENDRIRFIRKKDGLFEEYIDVAVKEYRNGYYVIDFLESLPELTAGTLIEIMAPKLVQEQDFYYEIASCIPINNPGALNRSHSVTSLLLETGDTYRRVRHVNVNNDNVTFIGNDVEDHSFSDFYTSRVEDRGRSTIFDNRFGRIERPSLILVTSGYIADTKINGLNLIFGVSFRELERRRGGIQRLILAGNVMLAIQEFKVSSIYIREGMITTVQGVQLAVTSDAILSYDNELQGDVGTQHPESIYEIDTKVFGYDEYRQVAWRYSNNGIILISYYKMANYFRGITDRVRHAPAVYDKFYDEYLLTLEQVQEQDIDVIYRLGQQGVDSLFGSNIGALDIYPGDKVRITYTSSVTGAVKTVQLIVVSLSTNIINVEADLSNEIADNSEVVLWYEVVSKRETLCFAERKNRWTTFYSFTPEMFAAIGSSIASFESGGFLFHDVGVVNTFNGTQYPSEIHLIANPAPDIDKIWTNIRLDQLQEDNLSDWEAFEISNDNGQLSRLISTKFRRIEEYWWAAFMRDLNSPNTNFPLLNGRVLRSSFLVIKLRNSSTGNAEIRAAFVRWQPSERITR